MFAGSWRVLWLLPLACLALSAPVATAPPPAPTAVGAPADLVRQATELGRARRFPEAIALAERIELLKSREWSHPYYWAAFVVAGAWEPLRAVAPQVAPTRFDVASVKSNTSGEMATRWTFEGGRFTATNVTLRALLSSAHGTTQQPLPDFQIFGGPAWISADRFDVVARVDEGNSASLPPLLRQLLQDRFGVKAHTEMRELPIYALTLARKDGALGPKLRRNTTDCAAVAAGRVAGERCGGQIVPGKVVARGTTMTQMVSGLARLMPNVGRPVVDRTGLTGAFDLELTWTPEAGAINAMPGMPMPPVDPNGPSLFTALQEQLGLKLESQHGPVEVLVIDSAARPTAD